MPRVKHGNYMMGDCDADLQNSPARHPAGVVANWELIFNQALDIIFEKVAGYTGGQIQLNRKSLGSKFFATKTAPVANFGSNGLPATTSTITGKVPVEWVMRAVGGNSTRATNWQLMIDLDDIPPGVELNGPDRPHIGYLLTGKGFHRIRVDGHIFVEHVIASRNSIGEEETVAAKYFATPMAESLN